MKVILHELEHPEHGRGDSLWGYPAHVWTTEWCTRNKTLLHKIVLREGFTWVVRNVQGMVEVTPYGVILHMPER